jgi:hypothetical protein
MGEYSKYKGEEVKIGTCSEMLYLRFDDRFKVEPLPGNVNTHTDINLLYRLPFPDEDHINPGGNYDPFRTLDFDSDFYDSSLIEDPGFMQLTHSSGLLVSVKCYHGLKLPQATEEAKYFWNGKRTFIKLSAVKHTAEGLRPVIKCVQCGGMWSYDIEDWPKFYNKLYCNDMKKRLKIYASIGKEQPHECHI